MKNILKVNVKLTFQSKTIPSKSGFPWYLGDHCSHHSTLGGCGGFGIVSTTARATFSFSAPANTGTTGLW